jgi:hypothetical protein
VTVIRTAEEITEVTDQELAAKLRSQLAEIVVTLDRISAREYRSEVNLYSDDIDRWHFRLQMIKTMYL